ncbi:hypothetical protein ACFLX0_02290 [Chloroflexota bacterium]
MSAKVYMLLSVSDGSSVQAIETLKGQTGVIIANILKGPPEIVLMIEASDKQQLAERTIRAMASVKSMTEYRRLLPTIMGSNTGTVV